MIEIIPAILPKYYGDIEHALHKVGEKITSVQIDFVDGTFAPNRTWPFTHKNEEMVDILLREEEGLPFWDDIDYEFDLMIADPLAQIDTFVGFGPARIIFHLASFPDAAAQEALLAYFESLPEIVRTTITFGMALGIHDDAQALAPYIPFITTIQCMGIEKVGFQGQAFDERVVAQVAQVHALYPEKNISVDGGMTVATAPLVVKAGATHIVAGSAIFGGDTIVSDVPGAIAALRRACWL